LTGNIQMEPAGLKQQNRTENYHQLILFAGEIAPGSISRPRAPSEKAFGA
jgi:hypothetical protein